MWTRVTTGGIALLGLAATLFAWLQPVRVVPRLGPAPAFTLASDDGPVTSAALWGDPYLLALRGPADDDRIGGTMARIAAGTRIEVATDPAAPPVDGWERLSGDARAVVADLGLLYVADGDGVPLIEQRIALVDEQGRLRRLYAGETDPAEVAADLALVREEAASPAMWRAVYEASHLFSCYR